ncbi:MAG: hypothetical protein AAF533_27320 [Acidobacteriota bacterium]
MSQRTTSRNLPPPSRRPAPWLSVASFALLSVMLLPSTSRSQGRTDYYNVESPQVHPIEIAAVSHVGGGGTRELLLVVNTPDNSLEIYDTEASDFRDGPLPIERQFKLRVRTGLEPVSVRWLPTLQRFYVANFLGDSITSGQLEWDDARNTPVVTDFKTVEVIDEPLDMTHVTVPGASGSPSTEVLVVAHMTLDTLGLYDPVTLLTVNGGYVTDPSDCHQEIDAHCVHTDPNETPRFRRRLPAGLNDYDGDTLVDDINGDADLDGDGDIDVDLNGDTVIDEDDVALAADDAPDPGVDTLSLKQPWTLAVTPAASPCDRLFGLGHLGGSHQFEDRHGFSYDVDFWSQDTRLLLSPPTNALQEARIRGGLGTANWNMVFDEAGTLYVLSGRAQNRVIGEAAARIETTDRTGFVQSFLHVIETPCALAPVVDERDLNLRCTSPPCAPTSLSPAPASSSVAQPTDLAVRRVTGGREVFLTSFGNDRIVKVTLGDGEAAHQWSIETTDLSMPSDNLKGPRGLILQRPDPSDSSLDRLFVLSRLENSIHVISADDLSELESFDLQHDPTPTWIMNGRQFLYDARLSANGFDSCASCHLDGRTDGLAWDLSEPDDATPHPIPEQLLTIGAASDPEEFGPSKRFMVTQSLQGLLNHELPQRGSKTTDPDVGSQRLVTNAPYHWRGDRASFVDFNGAFDKLLGSSELHPIEMHAFEEFVNSIHYPPNPKQPKNRRFSGDFIDPADPKPNDPDQGTMAMLGFRLFHLLDSQLDSEPACVHCHALPEGSDNTLSLPSGIDRAQPFFFTGTDHDDKPLEGAALRGLYQKEARRTVDPTGPIGPGTAPITGFEGLSHTGLNNFSGSNNDETIARFIRGQFGGSPGGTLPRTTQLAAISQFVHEFDFGTGPIVGRSFTVTQQTWETLTDDWLFAEEQADLANAGLAVLASLNGVEWGFYYDPSSDALAGGDLLRYRRETSTGPGPIYSRNDLKGLLQSGDWMVVISTPLGSERRLASPTGMPPTLARGILPTSLQFLPMVPNTALQCATLMNDGWEIDTALKPNTSQTIRIYQYALLGGGPIQGLDAPRHVVPRRFRVSGHDLVHGAMLNLLVPTDQPPNPGVPPTSPNQARMVHLELPLHPTNERNSGAPIWETSVEIDPLFVYRMMTGQPTWPTGTDAASNNIMQGFAVVDHRLSGTTSFHVDPTDPTHLPFTTFNPSFWNRQYAWLTNGDGQDVPLGWVSVSLEPITLADCQ